MAIPHFLPFLRPSVPRDKWLRAKSAWLTIYHAVEEEDFDRIFIAYKDQLEDLLNFLDRYTDIDPDWLETALRRHDKEYSEKYLLESAKWLLALTPV